MTYQEYEIAFREKAKSIGYSEEHIIKCLNYAKPLIEQKIPIIFSTSHLCSLVGYTKNYLKRASKHTIFFYRKFTIPKKNGTKRIIYEPLPSLKEIQKWILKEILYKIPVSKFAKAYIPQKSIKDNVKYHKGFEKVVTLDIEKFFPSISRGRIEKLFRDLGYSKFIANLLSKLCSLNEHLPEGAPTSPYLSNLVLKKFDKELEIYCSKYKIRYTRYADDLTFSGNEFDEKALIAVVESNLADENLHLNNQKTKVILQGSRQLVTGLVVNKKIQVPKVKRKEIRQAVYFIKKYGLKSHLRKIDCKKSNYLKHLLGEINFVLFINPDDREMISYKEYINNIIVENENKRQILISNSQNQDFQEEIAQVFKIAQDGVLCLLSAAMHYDLTDFVPSQYYIAIPKKSNVSLPDYPPIDLFYWESLKYTLGITSSIINGVETPIYDIEKTVCDLVAYRKELGEDLALEVLKNYLKLRHRNIVKLMDYANKLGYQHIISGFLKILL